MRGIVGPVEVSTWVAQLDCKSEPLAATTQLLAEALYEVVRTNGSGLWVNRIRAL